MASSTIDALNSLLTGSRDGAENCRDAAGSIQHPDIQCHHNQVASWLRQDPGRAQVARG
jgi:hypothetical protein